MRDVLPFPPRTAGRVLDVAMCAAMEAARAEAAQREASLREVWGAWSDEAWFHVEHIKVAAVAAASPHLAGLTSDARMVETVARGLAEEAVIRLRKSGEVP